MAKSKANGAKFQFVKFRAPSLSNCLFFQDFSRPGAFARVFLSRLLIFFLSHVKKGLGFYSVKQMENLSSVAL